MSRQKNSAKTKFFFISFSIFIFFMSCASLWIVLKLFLPDWNSEKIEEEFQKSGISIFDDAGKTSMAAKSQKEQLNPDKTCDDILSEALKPDTMELIYIRVSSPENMKVPYEIDTEAGKRYRKIYNGRRINIAVTGVDSRLGSRFKHADANHVFSILINKGIAEITAIPRDTEADAGLEDSTGQNKLAVVRGLKGRNAYLKEAARIAGLDRIHYYVEFGFSQAMGILEWLGYEESATTLQVLRSRNALDGDDFQRCYNQAHFMRQVIAKHFEKFTGILGEVTIRGGLSLVETNLNLKRAKYIISKLKAHDFPKDSSAISIRIRPPIHLRFKKYDFTDKQILEALKYQVEYYSKNHANNSKSIDVANKLNSLIQSAIEDSAKHPALVISRLKTYFDQRAWLQIADKQERSRLREEFATLLSNAYKRKNRNGRAEQILAAMEAEKKLLGHTDNKKANDTTKSVFGDSTNFRKKVPF